MRNLLLLTFLTDPLLLMTVMRSGGGDETTESTRIVPEDGMSGKDLPVMITEVMTSTDKSLLTTDLMRTTDKNLLLTDLMRTTDKALLILTEVMTTADMISLMVELICIMDRLLDLTTEPMSVMLWILMMMVHALPSLTMMLAVSTVPIHVQHSKMAGKMTDPLVVAVALRVVLLAKQDRQVQDWEGQEVGRG